MILPQVQALVAKGLRAVRFDLNDTKTFANLPPASELRATVVTFALSHAQLAALQTLFANHIGAAPVLCYGTSGVFTVGLALFCRRFLGVAHVTCSVHAAYCKIDVC